MFSAIVERFLGYSSDLRAYVEASSRQWVQQQRMSDGQVCCVGNVERPAGDGLLSVVADDRRCLRLRRSSLPGTAVLCCAGTGDCHAELVPDRV